VELLRPRRSPHPGRSRKGSISKKNPKEKAVLSGIYENNIENRVYELMFDIVCVCVRLKNFCCLFNLYNSDDDVCYVLTDITSFKDVSATEFAEQLTWLEFETFRKISDSELLDVAWVRAKEKAPNVLKMVDMFNKVLTQFNSFCSIL
jgi:hypothetical protein